MEISSMDKINEPTAEAAARAEGATITRRVTLQAAAALAAVPPSSGAVAAPPAVAPLPARPALAGQTVALRTTVNGQGIEAEIDARTSLLDFLRERLGLAGAKKGCDHGQCGACTVHVHGRRVLSCLTLAAKVEGREVTTIEGLSDGKELPSSTTTRCNAATARRGRSCPRWPACAKATPPRRTASARP